MRRLDRTALVIATSWLCACATGSPSPVHDPIQSARADLERDDFPSAKAELLEAASRYEEGQEPREALLLAASQIDRIQNLERRVRVQADSLAALRKEMQRINDLLTSTARRSEPTDHR